MAVRVRAIDQYHDAYSERDRRRHDRTVAEESEWLRDDFGAFIRHAWHVIEPDTPFVPGWHIDAIAEHLTAVTEGEIRRLAVLVPPGYMKSRTCSVLWPVWSWTRRPRIRFITASYGATLSTDLAVLSRDLIVSQWFQDRWGDSFALRSDVAAKSWYWNDRGGRRMATSVGGVGTGQHADAILIDDPLNAKEVTSDAKLNEVIRWHDGTISTRFADPRRGQEIIIMQRLHQRDLVGHVLDRDGQGRWTVLCIPEEYEPSHPNRYEHDPRSEPGELAWPARIGPEEHEERKRSLGIYRAVGQLQQRPSNPQGTILLRSRWRYYDPGLLDNGAGRMPAFTHIVHSWDTTYRDKTSSDYVVGSTWGIKGADRYLLRITRQRLSLTATCTALKEHYVWGVERWPSAAHHTLVENSANGPAVIETMKREVPGIVPVPVQGDKKQRAVAASADLDSGNCFLPGAPDADLSGPDVARTPADIQGFIEECAAFDNGEYDDQVDSFTQMINWIRTRSSALQVSVATGPLIVGA